MPRPTEAPAGLAGLDQVLARAGDGACVVGADGRLALWNRSAERLLGYAARDVVGRPCCEVFGGFDDNGNRLCFPGCHVLSLTRLDEPVQSFDMRTRTRAGQPLWINVSILRAPGPNGAPITIHLFRKVTATRQLLELVEERLPPPRRPEPGEPEPTALSRRELELLRLMTEGVGTRGASQRLHVSPATIRNHAQNIFTKLGVHSRLEAVAYAIRHRLF